MIRVNNITLNIDEPIDELKTKVAKIMRVSQSEIKEFKIAKESIDARKKIILSLIMQLILQWIMK